MDVLGAGVAVSADFHVLEAIVLGVGGGEQVVDIDLLRPAFGS